MLMQWARAEMQNEMLGGQLNSFGPPPTTSQEQSPGAGLMEQPSQAGGLATSMGGAFSGNPSSPSMTNTSNGLPTLAPANIPTQQTTPITTTSPATANESSTASQSIPLPQTAVQSPAEPVIVNPGTAPGAPVLVNPTSSEPPIVMGPNPSEAPIIMGPAPSEVPVVVGGNPPPPITPQPITTPIPVTSIQQNANPETNQALESDVAQFESWLKNNTQKKPPRLVASAHPSTAGVIPPPPTSSFIPPKPKARKHLKKKPIVFQKGPCAPLVQSPPISYVESQKIMLNSAPPASSPPNPDSEEAFKIMTQQNVPLSPQQVVRLRQIIDRSQRAAAIPANIPPKPVSSTLMINLAPGSTPPAIRLAQGYVSSLVFVDSTGAPWPIAAFDLGNPKATNIQWDGKSNIVLLQSLTPYVDSNLIIRLVGLPTPLSLELVSGQRVVDYRTDIHVPGIGPNTQDIPIGVGLPNSANQLLLSVLDGIAPPGSKQLNIKCTCNHDCQAWLLGDRIFLRTRLTVLSPGWVGKMVSPDGMIAYEMPKTSSILVSQYGDPVELRLEGF